MFLVISQNSQAQVFSCEFWEISKNICFTEHVWATASGIPKYGSQSSKDYLQRKWFSKHINWMPTTLTKMNSFIGNFQDFCLYFIHILIVFNTFRKLILECTLSPFKKYFEILFLTNKYWVHKVYELSRAVLLYIFSIETIFIIEIYDV